MIIDQGRGVTVKDLAFASAEDFYSTACIALNVLTYQSTNPVKLFKANIGDNGGQGFAGVTLTIGETNNKNGDRQSSNNVYIATHFGFQIYATSGVESLAMIPINNPHDLQVIASNTAWSLLVGDGIKRVLGLVIDWPQGGGVDGHAYGINAAAAATQVSWANLGWVGCSKRKLPIPIVFPPNIQVEIDLVTGAPQTLLDNADTTPSKFGGSYSGGAIAFKGTFTGFRMTMPA